MTGSTTMQMRRLSVVLVATAALAVAVLIGSAPRMPKVSAGADRPSDRSGLLSAARPMTSVMASYLPHALKGALPSAPNSPVPRTASATGTPESATVTPTTSTDTPSPSTTPSATNATGHGPDLVVTDLRLTMEGPACNFGQPWGIRIQFKNQGTTATGHFIVAVNGERRPYPSGLGPNESANMWFRTGNYIAVGDVDVGNNVVETDETNNQLLRQMPVPTAPVWCPTPTPAANPPDLVVTRMVIGMEDDACYYGQPEGVFVTFANVSGDPTGPFVVRANSASRAWVPGLEAGNTGRLWFADADANQDGETVGIVDVSGYVRESNEDNNELRQRLPVPVPTAPVKCPTPTDVPPR